MASSPGMGAWHTAGNSVGAAATRLGAGGEAAAGPLTRAIVQPCGGPHSYGTRCHGARRTARLHVVARGGNGSRGDGPPDLPRQPPDTDRVGRIPRPLSRGSELQLPFRYWVDEVLWSQGRVAVQLIEQVFTEAGGVKAGGASRAEERARQQRLAHAGGGDSDRGGALGSGHMGSWEVLWTKSTYAIPAARAMRPGQLVSAVIGLNCLTMKKRLLQTLVAAYGPGGAAALCPRSFALPEQLEEWAGWVARHGQRQLWMLKTGQDAGKGLSLLPGEEAVRYARQQLVVEGAAPTGGAGSHRQQPKRFQLQVAQQYVTNPLLVLGRKCHLRLWVLVTAHSPLRAYLHRRGLVLFSSEPYDPAAPLPASASSSSAYTASPAHHHKPQHTLHDDAVQRSLAAPPASHVTNYAQNANTLVWGLAELEEHLGPAAWAGLWPALCGACARALGAARGALAEANAWLRPTVQEYGFQVMGVDFLLDEQLHPWLLEFNSSPSIMVQHEQPDCRTLIHEQKYGMLRDTWALVARRVWRPEEADGGDAGAGGGGRGAGGPGRGHWRRSAVRQAAEAERAEEAALAGTEYEPLRPYLPPAE
ncbi:hypothetical protein HYH02_001048 [Chlamydomonas schloesseri]|uniref:Tubulin--tyrosine ligase-like protein 5 n=1 Tax=Chlamydomonas schloesseri TaxID=2026947 RepID=A0A835WX70_9CHLO|nr:hypothetical protein HYH02_001048 [Chlamydomonas schloesseri]|eukprot:KAG2454005.1 hypothetical protein HYH02_001048 [Chlamydomonas schloesseri]